MDTCAGNLGYPFENEGSKMAVSVRFLCHLPTELMAIHFFSKIACLIVERISQVASTRDKLEHLVIYSLCIERMNVALHVYL